MRAINPDKKRYIYEPTLPWMVPWRAPFRYAAWVRLGGRFPTCWRGPGCAHNKLPLDGLSLLITCGTHLLPLRFVLRTLRLRFLLPQARGG